MNIYLISSIRNTRQRVNIQHHLVTTSRVKRFRSPVISLLPELFYVSNHKFHWRYFRRRWLHRGDNSASLVLQLHLQFSHSRCQALINTSQLGLQTFILPLQISTFLLYNWFSSFNVLTSSLCLRDIKVM